jgi:hypothetical protein
MGFASKGKCRNGEKIRSPSTFAFQGAATSGAGPRSRGEIRPSCAKPFGPKKSDLGVRRSRIFLQKGLDC